MSKIQKKLEKSSGGALSNPVTKKSFRSSLDKAATDQSYSPARRKSLRVLGEGGKKYKYVNEEGNYLADPDSGEPRPVIRRRDLLLLKSPQDGPNPTPARQSRVLVVEQTPSVHHSVSGELSDGEVGENDDHSEQSDQTEQLELPDEEDQLYDEQDEMQQRAQHIADKDLRETVLAYEVSPNLLQIVVNDTQNPGTRMPLLELITRRAYGRNVGSSYSRPKGFELRDSNQLQEWSAKIAPHVTVSNGFQATMVTELNHRSLKKLESEFLRANSSSLVVGEFATLISRSLHTELQVELCSQFDEDGKPWLINGDSDEWKQWDHLKFFERVLKVYVPDNVRKDGTILHQLQEHNKIWITGKNRFESVDKVFQFVKALQEAHSDDDTPFKTLADLLIKKIRTCGSKLGVTVAGDLTEFIVAGQKPGATPITSIPQLWGEWKKKAKALTKGHSITHTYFECDGPVDSAKRSRGELGDVPAQSDSFVSKRQRRAEQRRNNGGKPATSTKPSTPLCKHCGRYEHRNGKPCAFVEKKHPDVNYSELPFAESDKGKAWKLRGEDSIPFKQTLSGVRHDMGERPNQNGGSNRYGKGDGKKHHHGKHAK